MKIHLAVYLSKAWRSEIRAVGRSSPVSLEQTVAVVVSKALRDLATEGQLSVALEVFSTEYKQQMYSPNYLTMEPWELWDRVDVLIQTTGNAEVDPDLLRSLLLKKLPEMSHVEAICPAQGNGTD